MKRESLSTIVFERLIASIHSGELAPGMQLPTEAELGAEFEVSRTVIREAIARLRSEGQVVPRQGKGVFVSDAPRRSFSIPTETLRTLPQTLSFLELRLALETEAAARCAMRRTEAEARQIRIEMESADSAYPNPEDVQVHYDFDFHLAIAKAAHNDYIYEFLLYLKPILVPRFQLSYVVASEMKDKYFDRIHAEHEAIVRAIEVSDPEAARNAMRLHLENSLERLRALARSTGQPTAAEPGAGSLFGSRL
ncbi:FadR/GntR family transcriptional regulator [Fuscibacter oryzae]|uniref:FadR family transcriptional regulator n=1 Tax=Fuscibacter oryzae TaxID=2803939 RepID=A0A8J7MSA8_9RHOB|nr:FadR/GntR family transcriptional regulator [Fuscibacter oryzae]MBL4929418.1 FadR family transcriptional regulator [Fuscibacter oryzae]